MTDDELAAVAAAFRLLGHEEPGELAPTKASRWSVAARMRVVDVDQVRLAQRAPSRWAISERLRD